MSPLQMILVHKISNHSFISLPSMLRLCFYWISFC
ncbi:unnamed protein product [Arabidopsis halleri]